MHSATAHDAPRPGAKNLGLILRYADAGGRPMSNSEFCHSHGRKRVERDRAVGIKVYDDREAP